LRSQLVRASATLEARSRLEGYSTQRIPVENLEECCGCGGLPKLDASPNSYGVVEGLARLYYYGPAGERDGKP